MKEIQKNESLVRNNEKNLSILINFFNQNIPILGENIIINYNRSKIIESALDTLCACNPFSVQIAFKNAILTLYIVDSR